MRKGLGVLATLAAATFLVLCAFAISAIFSTAKDSDDSLYITVAGIELVAAAVLAALGVRLLRSR